MGVRTFRARHFATAWQDHHVGIAIGLMFLTLALYSPASHYPFINYDDPNYVTQNAHLRAGLSWTTLKWALTTTEQANWHPATWLSHALDYQLFGLNATGHHLTSMLLHALNAALLFLLLVRATGASGRSLLAAALFAIHPLNVESVAWVAERKNVLCVFFFLLGLAAYGRYARKPTIARYVLLTSLFTLSLASKPMAITLPCVLLLIDFWPLRRIQGWGSPSAAGSQESFGTLVLEKVPLFALSAGSAVITLVAQHSGGAMPSSLEVPLLMRFTNAIQSYVIYLWKALWPTRLAPFYPGSPPVTWQVLLAATFLLAVSLSVCRARRKCPWLLVGWLWYLGTLVPMIGIIQVGGQAMADRYAYIPLIGVFVMVIWGLAHLFEGARVDPRLPFLAALAVVILLSVLTLRQLSNWRSSYDLWSHTLQVSTNNLVAEDNLGVELLALGRAEEALPHFQNAVRINPLDPLSHVNIGADDQGHGRLPEAIAEYTSVIRLTSDPKLLTVAYENLGAIYRQLGDFPKALESYQRVLQINPQETRAFMAIAVLRREQADRQVSSSKRAGGK